VRAEFRVLSALVCIRYPVRTTAKSWQKSRVITWTARIGLLLSCLAWAISYLQICYRDNPLLVGFTSGAFVWTYTDRVQIETYIEEIIRKLEAAQDPAESREEIARLRAMQTKRGLRPITYPSLDTTFMPRWAGNPMELVLPLWIPAAFFGYFCWVMCALQWRARRRQECGQCTACGYDLRGQISDYCPECRCAVCSSSTEYVAP
jgi:hypothetical protein